ncbi:ABC transporter permease [Acidobacteriota bacterium]
MNITGTGRPPRQGVRIFKLLYRRADAEQKLGDLEEIFRWRDSNNKKFASLFWFYMQIIRLIWSECVLSIYWSFSMFRNYFKVALRNLKRQKAYSLISISGLALGMAAFLLISVWVLFEFGYDRFHENGPSIYRINEKRVFADNTEYGFRTPGPLADVIKEKYSEVREAVRVSWTGERVIRFEDKVYYENGIMTVDPAFFRIFSFPFESGEKDSVFDGLFSIVVSEDIARKYFGNENPIGQVLSLDNRFDFTVTGVMKNVPENSTMLFDMAVPFEIVKRLGWDTEAWDFSVATTYLHLDESVDVRVFEKKIFGIVKQFDPDTRIELFLQPLSDVHLYSNFAGLWGTLQYMYVLSFIGFLILLIACINFMNLATARAESRALEIGIRKVVGADRIKLIRQFLAEAIFVAFTAILLAPVLLHLFLPEFNKTTGYSFSLGSFLNWRYLLLVLGVTLFTGLASGVYPALFLSSFRPAGILKGLMSQGRKRAYLRKGLVLVQVAISLGLIITSMVVFKQVDFLKNKDLGFDKDNVVAIPLGISNEDNNQIFERFKIEVQNDPAVERIAASFTHPRWLATPTQNIVYNGKKLDEEIPISITSVDFGFVETLKIEVIKGRSFSQEFGSERGNLIVNERFEELMGVESALGKTFSIGESYKGSVVGVMRDFHFESVADTAIGPLILFCNPGVNYIFARISPGNIPAALSSLEEAWNRAVPNLPFQYNFLDQDFNELYRNFESIGTNLKYFTFLAGILACMGLLGLASFSTEKRTKEIGVRKILGASSGSIVKMLCRDFVMIVVIANLVAGPLSWLLMRNWLKRFPYHIGLDWNVFILSGFFVMVITLLTVGFQTVRASLSDPVKSLRYE